MPTVGTVNFRNRLRYKSPNPAALVGSLTPFASFAPGIENQTNWSIYFNDFLRTSDYDATNDWTATTTGAGSSAAISDDVVPGHLILTCDAADNDSVEVQLTGAGGAGEVFLPAAGRKIYFETRIRLRDANNNLATVQQADLFVGLAVTDTTLIDGATDFIGFSKVDGSGDIKLVSADAASTSGALVDGLLSSAVKTLAAAQANTWIKLAFLLDGTGAIYVWVDDTHVLTQTTNVSAQVPDTECCVSLAIQNGEAVAKIMDVDYVLAAQTR